MKKRLLTALLFLMAFGAFAQKQEFRAAWIATVQNVDFPSSKTLSPDAQRREFTDMLDGLKRLGMNAVVVQVRPSCDAIYPSNIEPWTESLTGQQGKAPSPLYDPLQFMIEEARKRNLEFHAWFNPYRAVVGNTASIDDSHISRRQPTWLLKYGELQMLNPALPEVRNYVVNVIKDVLTRYDIDAVHFDDYFYPYPQTGLTLDDNAAFAAHPRGFTNRDDWRRDNVNLLVQQTAQMIKAEKPYVRFGISPFGIWRNSSADPNGSNTRGLDAYSTIYADALKWLREGWVDYIAPQVYWSIGFSAAPYENLIPWWAKNTFGKHLYIGQAAYRVGTTTDPNFAKANELPNQIRLNRRTAEVKGSLQFSTKVLLTNTLGFADSLRLNLNRLPAFVPPMVWIDNMPPDRPRSVNVQPLTNGATVTWQAPDGTSPMDAAHYYAVYRFDNPNVINLNDQTKIKAVVPKTTLSFTDNFTVGAGQQFTYVVTAFDRNHNESNPAIFNVTITGSELTEVAGGIYLEQNFPNPLTDRTRIRYRIGKASNVSLKIYKLTGEEVSNLVGTFQQSGEYEIEASLSYLPKGVYIYRLTTIEGTLTKRMLVE